MAMNDCHAKLRRAGEHLEALHAAIGSFLQPNPYRIAVERATSTLFVIRIVNPPDFPAELFAVIIGDVVHNLRASLDYAAWQLAGANTKDKETQFPIFETQAGWDGRAQRRIKRMPAAAQAFVETLQPFHSVDPAVAALNVLRILNDADKHKLLTVTVALQHQLSFSFVSEHAIPIPYRINALQDSVLTHGAVLATVVLSTDDVPNPPLPSDLNMTASFAPDVAFAESIGLGARVMVLQALSVLLLEVTAVVTALERRFFPHKTPQDHG